MQLVFEGAIVGAKSDEFTDDKGKVHPFHRLSISSNGEVTDFKTDEATVKTAEKFLLKSGVYALGISIRKYGKNQTIVVTSLTPAK